jgi:hypothetical protein
MINVFFFCFQIHIFATIRSRFYLGSINVILITHVLVSKVITKLVKLVGECIYIPCHCPLGPPFTWFSIALTSSSLMPTSQLMHTHVHGMYAQIYLINHFFFWLRKIAKMGH